ncbi:MAG: hypothetical protein JWP63_6228, partial [Candidatus Solibacter sp.]|nr:hypothetical protein [Candidatus Solibacter sp.]
CAALRSPARSAAHCSKIASAAINISTIYTIYTMIRLARTSPATIN